MKSCEARLLRSTTLLITVDPALQPVNFTEISEAVASIQSNEYPCEARLLESDSSCGCTRGWQGKTFRMICSSGSDYNFLGIVEGNGTPSDPKLTSITLIYQTGQFRYKIYFAPDGRTPQKTCTFTGPAGSSCEVCESTGNSIAIRGSNFGPSPNSCSKLI